MPRLIHLPAIDESVTVGQYVAAIRLAKENPAAEFKHGLTTWWPVTGAEIMRQFRAGVQDRINQAIPYNRRSIKPRPLKILLRAKISVDS